MKTTITFEDVTPEELQRLQAAAFGTSSAVINSPAQTVTTGYIAPANNTTTENESDADEGSTNNDPNAGLGLDKAGLPWDARIHSSNKKTKADGTWNVKKGVDKASIPVVEAELRARMAAGANTQPAVYGQPAPVYGQPPAQNFQQPPYNPQVPPSQPYTPPYNQQGGQPVVNTPPVYNGQPQPAYGSQSVPQTTAPMDYMGLMNLVSTLLTQNVINQDYIGALAREIGINAITDIGANPALVVNACNILRRDGKIA